VIVAQTSRSGAQRGTKYMQDARMETWQTLATVCAIWVTFFVNHRFARA
jgi:hypothetical protein